MMAQQLCHPRPCLPAQLSRTGIGKARTTKASKLALEACLRCGQQACQRSSGQLLVPKPSKLEARQSRAHAAQAPQQEPSTEEESASREPPKGNEPEEQRESLGVRAALALLSFYKNGISPLLPPSCRYIPTCSVYAMDAYKEFGVAKGTLLTAWRLMRCSPFGSSGFDPVRWPPPGLEWMFKA